MVNSRLGLFAAAPSRERPFSRSYGAILPSSLTTVRPIPSVCSTGPPVSVCGTGARGLERARIFWDGLRPKFARCFPGWSGHPDFPGRGRPEPRPAYRRRLRARTRGRCRNVNLPSIGYASRPRLRSRLTLGGLAFPRKPRAFGGRVSRPPLATRASILTSARSTGPRRTRFAARGKLPYRCTSKGRIPPLRRVA